MVSDAATVSVIGDCALDVTAALPGTVVPAGDHAASIGVGPGGQGANVAVRLARRGLAVRLITALGADPPADWLRARIEAEGVVLANLATGSRATSVVIALLDQAGERTMLSDRAPIETTTAGLTALLAGSAWVHCSGYVLRDPAEAAPVVEVLAGRPDALRLGISGGSAGDDDTAAHLMAAVRRARPDLLVVSLDESRWLIEDSTADPGAAASRLAAVAALAVVTAGSRGAHAAITGQPAIHVPAADAGPVLDATGAGDAFTATLLARLVGAAWPPTPELLRIGLADASLAGGLAAGVAGAQGPIRGERGTGTVSAT